MNNMKNKIKSIVALAFAGVGLTGCSLEMLPLNEVVLENYWTNKNDVESVVNSCYHGMQENGYVSDMIVWGEDRSDNVSEAKDVPADLKNLMKGNLKTTNPYCDWAAMYKVINRCNTVLYYAPKVAETDPNYTTSDLAANIAEVKALRAISYLTLIKTFKDVPFSLEPSIDDNQEYRLGQTGFTTILDALIADIEECKEWAPVRYSESVYNSGKITRVAMYSLLAELYLWRAADYNLSAAEQDTYYKSCIEYCDKVLEYKLNQYSTKDIQGVDFTKYIDQEVIKQYGYPLLAEEVAGLTGAFASTWLFGEGNSYESIFEVTYTYGSTKTVNEDLALMYGGYNDKEEKKVYVAGNSSLMTKLPANNATYSDLTLFGTTTDYRALTSFYYKDGENYNILKYIVSDNFAGSGSYGKVSASIFTPASSDMSSSYYRGSYKNQDMNWIIYRLSEIMLFRAEAEMEIAAHMAASETDTSASEGTDTEEKTDSEDGTNSDNTTVSGSKVLNSEFVSLRGASLVNSSAKELYDDAFNLISAVYLRSNPACKSNKNAAPQRDNYKNIGEFRKLLLNERQREFLFEGKRYFDLVRMARRLGNTSDLQSAIVSKFGEASKAVVIKMAKLDFMYMPVAKSQIKVNPMLKQNPCYDDEEETVKN